MKPEVLNFLIALAVFFACGIFIKFDLFIEGL